LNLKSTDFWGCRCHHFVQRPPAETPVDEKMTRYPPEQQQRPHAVADPVGRDFFEKLSAGSLSHRRKFEQKNERNVSVFCVLKRRECRRDNAGAKLSGTIFGRNPLEHTGRSEMPPEFPQRSTILFPLKIIVMMALLFFPAPFLLLKKKHRV
jgi:hypothetical protein